jgi:SAM-dependent methyltransferase
MDATVISLDLSSYEGAEVVHDLNEPLPPKLHDIADFIINGSCLDNLFDPATAIKSLSKMLRPGGRMLSFELGTQAHGAFVMYSPEWFFGFYAANNYDGCRIYIAHFDEDLHDDYDIYLWAPFIEKDGEIHPSPNRVEDGDYFIYALGIKGQNSTNDRTPIQGFYRMMQSRAANAHYVERAQHFEASHPTISIRERPGLPIKHNRLGFAEKVYATLTGVPLRKWIGVSGRPQLRIGNRRTKGPNFRFLGTLRNRPPGALSQKVVEGTRY